MTVRQYDLGGGQFVDDGLRYAQYDLGRGVFVGDAGNAGGSLGNAYLTAQGSIGDSSNGGHLARCTVNGRGTIRFGGHLDDASGFGTGTVNAGAIHGTMTQTLVQVLSFTAGSSPIAGAANQTLADATLTSAEWFSDCRLYATGTTVYTIPGGQLQDLSFDCRGVVLVAGAAPSTTPNDSILLGDASVTGAGGIPQPLTGTVDSTLAAAVSHIGSLGGNGNSTGTITIVGTTLEHGNFGNVLDDVTLTSPAAPSITHPELGWYWGFDPYTLKKRKRKKPRPKKKIWLTRNNW